MSHAIISWRIIASRGSNERLMPYMFHLSHVSCRLGQNTHFFSFYFLHLEIKASNRNPHFFIFKICSPQTKSSSFLHHHHHHHLFSCFFAAVHDVSPVVSLNLLHSVVEFKRNFKALTIGDSCHYWLGLEFSMVV